MLSMALYPSVLGYHLYEMK